MITVLVFIGCLAYLIIGLVFLGTFAWCLGMPASSCRTAKQRLKKATLEYSMIVGWPVWILVMVVTLMVGK